MLSVATVEVVLDRRLGGIPPFFPAPSGMPCLASWNRLVSWSLLLSPNPSQEFLQFSIGIGSSNGVRANGDRLVVQGPVIACVLCIAVPFHIVR